MHAASPEQQVALLKDIINNKIGSLEGLAKHAKAKFPELYKPVSSKKHGSLASASDNDQSASDEEGQARETESEFEPEKKPKKVKAKSPKKPSKRIKRSKKFDGTSSGEEAIIIEDEDHSDDDASTTQSMTPEEPAAPLSLIVKQLPTSTPTSKQTKNEKQQPTEEMEVTEPIEDGKAESILGASEPPPPIQSHPVAASSSSSTITKFTQELHPDADYYPGAEEEEEEEEKENKTKDEDEEAKKEAEDELPAPTEGERMVPGEEYILTSDDLTALGFCKVPKTFEVAVTTDSGISKLYVAIPEQASSTFFQITKKLFTLFISLR